MDSYLFLLISSWGGILYNSLTKTMRMPDSQPMYINYSSEIHL